MLDYLLAMTKATSNDKVRTISCSRGVGSTREILSTCTSNSSSLPFPVLCFLGCFGFQLHPNFGSVREALQTEKVSIVDMKHTLKLRGRNKT